MYHVEIYALSIRNKTNAANEYMNKMRTVYIIVSIFGTL